MARPRRRRRRRDWLDHAMRAYFGCGCVVSALAIIVVAAVTLAIMLAEG